jgi:hypothetical protein
MPQGKGSRNGLTTRVAQVQGKIQRLQVHSSGTRLCDTENRESKGDEGKNTVTYITSSEPVDSSNVMINAGLAAVAIESTSRGKHPRTALQGPACAVRSGTGRRHLNHVHPTKQISLILLPLAT